MTDRIVALIPAAGVGARAGGDLPKQYQKIAGRPVLAHTIAALKRVPLIEKIVIVIAQGDRFATELIALDDVCVTWLRVGGETRAETVKNGLAVLAKQYDEAAWVLVHDAARCCVEPAAITRLISACRDDDVGGLLAVPVSDTLKRGDDCARVQVTVPREHLWQAQTPQMARLGILRSALAHGDLTRVTDEASALEQVGAFMRLVDGGTHNIKVTYPHDFALAEAILRSRGEESSV